MKFVIKNIYAVNWRKIFMFLNTKLHSAVQKISLHPIISLSIPVIIVSIYLAIFMSDRYSSQAVIMIKKNSSSAVVTGLGAALGLGDVTANEDERILLAYLHSPDLLQKLENELQLKEHFTHTSIDWWSRLTKKASREEFLAFYRKHVLLKQDGATGLLNIEVQAYNASFSMRLAERILFHAEQFVNDINTTMASQQVEFMRQEVERAEEKLRKEKNAIINFQNENKVFSPEGQINALSGIIAELESELIREETQLKQYTSFLNPNAPQIVNTKAKIKALQEEIDKQQGRLVGGGAKNLNELNAQYLNLELNLQFATNNYTASINSFEHARAEASRKLRHLVVVSSPQLAEDAKYPKRFYWIATWVFTAAFLHVILSLIKAIIKEHKD